MSKELFCAIMVIVIPIVSLVLYEIYDTKKITPIRGKYRIVREYIAMGNWRYIPQAKYQCGGWKNIGEKGKVVFSYDDALTICKEHYLRTGFYADEVDLKNNNIIECEINELDLKEDVKCIE